MIWTGIDSKESRGIGLIRGNRFCLGAIHYPFWFNCMAFLAFRKKEKFMAGTSTGMMFGIM